MDSNGDIRDNPMRGVRWGGLDTMLKFWVRVALTVIGCVALGGAKPPDQSTDRDDRAGKSANAPPPAPIPSPTASPSPGAKFAAYPGYNPGACYHGEDHDAADLCAQWRAAIAAEKAAHEARRATNWAIVGTFLSAFGVLGLILSMWQTRSALSDARRSADAAEKQVEISDETAVKQLRAYVGIGHTKHRIGTLPDGSREIEITQGLRNFGSTPALRTSCGSIITGGDLKGVISFDEPPGEDLIISKLDPGASSDTPTVRITFAGLSDMYRKRLRCFICVYCTYDDMFDNRRHHEFAVELIVIKDPATFKGESGDMLTTRQLPDDKFVIKWRDEPKERAD